MALAVDSLDKMLNLEIHANPTYSGLEIQVFDDETHGSGVLVFLSRTDDGLTDVYHEPGLRLDPDGYAIGNGLGEWNETTFHPARVQFAPNGVDVDVGLTDGAGRSIRIRVDDRGGRVRQAAPFLAPMGAAIQSPNRLPLVWMNRFDLVRSRGQFEVTIDGDPVQIGRLPGALLHRRRLVKYAADLFVVGVNPSYEGAIDSAVVESVSGQAESHRARLSFDKALSLSALPADVETRGGWRLSIDDAADLIAGSWYATRSGSQVTLTMDVGQGWHPQGLPAFMRLVTTVAPVFRRWPTTYRWRAEIDLDRLWMSSDWQRTEGTGADSYQKLTASR